MTPRERLFALEQFGIKLGLTNIRTLVDALGRPDEAYATIHVAGTNGKGSVTAMVEAGLRAAGHRTGRYTSPHLFAIEERVAIDGMPLDSASFDAITADVLELADELIASGKLPHTPTFFEVTTAIALEAFRRFRVTAAAVEVGLGGRFDATNVIQPRVCAITSIDFDHERHLGTTLEQIAFEKAGIIKAATPVVLGAMPAPAHRVIVEVARTHHAPVIEARPAADGVPVPLALPGAHQRHNAAVAAEVLRAFAPNTGTRDVIRSAISDVQWPARLEWLKLPDGCRVLVDAAHNPAGAAALAEYVRQRGTSLPMVLGMMRDKNVDGIVTSVAAAVTKFVAVPVDSPRALPPQELATRIRQLLPHIACDVAESAEEAVARECSRSGAVMVAGSIFLVGPLRARLVSQGAQPVRYPSEASLFYLD